MKDKVFEGPDVPSALLQAEAATGLSAAALRYVVLEPGAAAGRECPRARPASRCCWAARANRRGRVRATGRLSPWTASPSRRCKA